MRTSSDSISDIKYWKFNGNTQDLLEEIFNEEYQLDYWYDNTSHWELRWEYQEYKYYLFDASGITSDRTKRYVDVTYIDAAPAEIQQFANGKRLYFDAGNGEILNYNDEYTATGWYMKNQYIDETDPSGTVHQGYYPDGTQCGYGYTDENGVFHPNPYVASDAMWIGFMKKYDWVTDCRLYYNVKQSKTFDQIIEDKLKSLSNADERLEYYQLLAGQEENSNMMYGNHQTLRNMLEGNSVRDYVDDGKLLNGFGWDMQEWNNSHCELDELHEGIDIAYDNGSKLYAPLDCEIKSFDADKNIIVLRKNDVRYWYDGNGSKNRDTEITICNAYLLEEIEEGDTLEQGQEFAVVTSYQHCDNLANPQSGDYVHIKVKVDTDGIGWDFIDPLLVLY